MAELLTTDTELQTVANAIRAKTGGSASLGYPDEFAAAIAGIGSDCTATAADIRSGKTAYAGNSKVTGSMTEKAAATYNPSASNQEIAAGQYLSGKQTIRKVTTSNLDAANIKTGVTVKIGDVEDDDRVASVTGTYTSDANATAAQILSGKTAYVNGTKISGTIPSKAAATYNTSNSDQTIAAGQYLSGAQTIRKVTTTNLTAANIKQGVTVKVGDSGNDERITKITGTCPASVMHIPVASDCCVPFMFKVGSPSETIPGFYWNDNGFAFYGGSASPHGFRVPCNIKMTYNDDSYVQHTYTFYTGTVYTLGIYNQNTAIISTGSGTLIVRKIIKFEIA